MTVAWSGLTTKWHIIIIIIFHHEFRPGWPVSVSAVVSSSSFLSGHPDHCLPFDAQYTASPFSIPTSIFPWYNLFLQMRLWRPSHGGITTPPLTEKMPLKACPEAEGSSPTTGLHIVRLLTWHKEIILLPSLIHRTAGWTKCHIIVKINLSNHHRCESRCLNTNKEWVTR
jgi:hypothetical protein